jgi:hypothetical protein
LIDCDHLNRFSASGDGLAIYRFESVKTQVNRVAQLFSRLVLERMTSDACHNRALIRRFVGLPDVSAVFSNSELLSAITKDFGVGHPVFLGPAVSHFTSNDFTGRGFGLPMHQDFPSMASSVGAVVAWIALSDCSAQTHSLRFLPGFHKEGLLPGEQTDGGYILDESFQNHDSSVVLNAKLGDGVIFTPLTPHSTFVNPNYSSWKMSISQRLDDYTDDEWLEAGLPSAYSTSVDRTLYLKRIESIDARR